MGIRPFVTLEVRKVMDLFNPLLLANYDLYCKVKQTDRNMEAYEG